MKLAFIGDIHAKGSDLERTAGALQQAVEDVSRSSLFCDEIIIAGDVFDRFNVADREASVGSVYRAVIDAVSFRKPISIVGNHDLAGAGQKDALEPLSEIIEVKRQMEIKIITDPFGDKIALLFIPWGCDPSISPADDTDFQNWHNANRRAIVAHCDIDGALTNTDRMMVGGSFSLDKDWLRSMNADVVALGHIHKRQDLGLGKVFGGYLGSLVQCNFGEGFCAIPGKEREHQPQGFLVWDTESNTIEWRDVQAARFWTVPTEWYADFHAQIPEGDRVKVKGTTRPLILPAGVCYEPIIEAVVRESRTTGIEADESPESLLQHWHGATQCKVDLAKLQEGLKKILGQIQLPGSAIGSLESLDKIELVNIATHRNTYIELDGVRGLVGISGHNGAGKTYAMESLYASLYGEYPSRPGTLADRVTRGFTGDAMIGVDFSSGGERYRAQRDIHKTEKTSKIEARLYSDENGKWGAIAGTKGADVTARAEQIVGDPSVILATIFSAQGQIGNIIDAEPRDRKEHFAKLLGTDRLLVIGEKAKELLGNDDRDLLYQERRIADLEMQLAGKIEAERSLAEQRKMVAPVEAQIRILNEQLDTVRRRHAELKAIQKRRNDVQAEISRVENEITSTRVKIQSKRQQIEAAQKRLEKRASLAATASKRSETESAIAKAEVEYNAAKDRRAELELKLANLRTEYQRIFGQMDALAKGQTAEIEKAISHMKDRISEVERNFQTKNHDIKFDLRNSSIRLDTAKRSAALLDSGNFNHDVCTTCAFTKNAFETKGSIPTIESEIVRFRDALEQNYREETEALAEPNALLQELQTRLQAFDPKAWMQTAPECAGLRDQLAENKRVGLETKAALDSTPIPDNSKIRTLRSQLDGEIATAERELKVLEEVEKSIVVMRGDIEQLQESIDHLTTRKATLETDLQAAELVDTAGTEKQIEEIQIDIRLRQDDLSTINQLIGQAQAELKRFEQIQIEIGKVKNTLQSIRERAEQWIALQAAFGRDGIPQLIVDSAIPRLQQLLSELLGEFDNRWAIRLDTQRETKAGTIQERIDIRVIDANGEGDISDYSGGEKHLLRSILRIAMGMLQAERSGKSLKVFIFDEAFDALDRENAIRLLAVFQHLLSRFNQVFIVSHSDELLAVLPAQIRFKKVNETTEVEVLNGAR